MVSSTQLIIRRRARKARKTAARRRSAFWWGLFAAAFSVLFVLPLGGAAAGAAIVYNDSIRGLPQPQQSISTLTAQGVTRFYDRAGTRLLYSLEDPLGDGRAWVPLQVLPAYVPTAMLVLEDPDFLQTPGFNPFSAASALLDNALIETRPPDASITGRLVRNLLNPTPSGAVAVNLARQREIALVAEINRLYSPPQVLEWHLNTEYYGNEAYGIEAAAQIYLGKPASALTLGEAALLAAIPNAPQYNPFEDEIAARARGIDALRMLRTAGQITDAEFEAAAAENIRFRTENYIAQLAPDFMTYARRQAEHILTDLGYDGRQMVARGGLEITTTLDSDLFLQAECALRGQLARLNGAPPVTEALDGTPCIGVGFLPETGSLGGAQPPDTGALVLLDAASGEIRALVGAADSALYQPGAALLPFVYLDAFVNPRQLTSPASMALDIPRSFPGAEEGLIYNPANPDGRFYGVMNLRSAMSAALLPPAAEMAFRQGMGSILRTAHQIGINTLADDTYDIMLLERGGRVSVLDLAYAYSVFATLGDMRGVTVEPQARGFRGRDPVAVREIRDRDGQLLWTYDSASATACATLDTCTPLLEDALAYLVNDVYADRTPRWQTLGQGNALEMDRPAAVVSGRGGDGTESWTIGYTPQIVAAVHVGRTDGEALSLDPWGVDGAGVIWRAVMDYAHLRDGLPAATWERPPLVTEMQVCERSGLIPNGVCPTYLEVFRDGMQPRQIDSYWQVKDVNSRTGQLATINTPAELVQQRTYFVPPDEALEWWRDANLPLPPVDYDTVSVPEVLSSTRILAPEAFSYVGGVVPVFGQMQADALQYYQLSYGQGLNPSSWIDVGGQRTGYSPGEALAEWDTAGLDGLYSLRLVVTREDNTFESDAVQVTIDNIAPAVALDSVELGKVYRFPGDAQVQLDARATDNIAISRVEFYHNDELLGADESWPYQLNWRISAPGTERFRAVVFDAVGNRAESEITIDILRAGG